jgi:hypothetical protein
MMVLWSQPQLRERVETLEQELCDLRKELPRAVGAPPPRTRRTRSTRRPSHPKHRTRGTLTPGTVAPWHLAPLAPRAPDAPPTPRTPAPDAFDAPRSRRNDHRLALAALHRCIAIVIGVAYFEKLAIDRGRIGETARHLGAAVGSR